MPIGVYKHKKRSKEIKEKISKTLMGHSVSKETREKIGKAHKNKIVSNETRKKISIANIGNKKRLGKRHSKKTKEKLRQVNLGKKHSKETKEKISKKLKEIGHLPPSNKGNKMTQESKDKISKNHSRYWLGKKQSKESIEKRVKQIRGDKNCNWKGGITPKNIKIRHSSEYKLWRESVFKKDNFTCQKYSTSGGELNAHHINNFADFPELRLEIKNGITLSKKAHKEFHKEYGNKSNTRKQLLEFLKKI